MINNELTSQPSASPPPQTHQMSVDESDVSVHYSNVCRLLTSPDELLVDFGFTPQLMGENTERIELTQRVTMGWFMAKRLLYVLHQTVARHEEMFGVLEMDPQKRVPTTRTNM